MIDKIKNLYSVVSKYEDYYYDIAGKALEKGNIQGNLIHAAEATAFQRVRYLIEGIFEEELNQ